MMNLVLKKNGRNLTFLYTLLFLVLGILLFARFPYYGKSMIGGADGLSQVGASMEYNGRYYRELFGELLRGHGMPKIWDLSVGMGMDVLHVLIWNPIQILCGLLFAGNPKVGTAVFAMLSLYLAGLAFLAYCRYLKCDRMAMLTGVCIYLGNGYILNYCIAQNVFLELYILLPLMLLGADRVQEKKKPGLLIACIFYLAITFLTNLYLLSLVLAGYLTIRYWCGEEQKNLKGFFRWLLQPLCAYFMGIALSAVILVPKIYLTLTSGRVGKAELGNYFLYDKKYYADLITGLLGTNKIGIHGFIGVSALAVLGIFLLFAVKADKRRFRELKIWGVLLAFMAALPLGSYITTGFMGFNHRFLFLLTFYLPMVTVLLLPRMISAEQEILPKTLILAGAYLAVLAAVSFWKREEIPFSAIFLLLYAGVWILSGSYHFFRKYSDRILLGLVCGELACSAYIIYEPMQGAYLSEFEDQKTVNEEVKITASRILDEIDDDSLYRVENMAADEKTNNREANFGTRNGYYALDGYYSYTYRDIIDTMNSLGISQMGNPFNIYDLDERTVLYTLGGVKYIAGFKEDVTAMPFGYQLLTEKKVKVRGKYKTLQLFKNQYSLPLMYAYESYIAQSDYEQMNPNEKEQAMMQGIVLDQTDTVQRITPEFDGSIVLNQEQIETQLGDREKERKKEEKTSEPPLEIKKNQVTCKEGSGKVEIKLPEGVRDCELYLCFENLRYEPKGRRDFREYQLQEKDTRYERLAFQKKSRADSVANRRAKVTAQASGVCKTAVLWGKNSQYDIGERDVLFHLGYSEKQRKKISVTWNGRGTYTYSNVYVIAQPMDSYRKNYEKRAQYTADFVKLEKNRIIGSIEVPREQMFCIAVPYHKGFTAFVNGERTEVKKANGMYMAVPVGAGKNEIELEFRLPGQRYGIYISLSAAAVMILVMCLRKKKERKGVQEDEDRNLKKKNTA